MISNNSFLDGIIHRQMRKHLLDSFHKVYILDLHGSSKRKETAPDGSPDQNVFDIMQGVSINLLVKTRNKGKIRHPKVYHFDLFGKRDDKYTYLNNSSLFSIKWELLKPDAPNFFWTKKNFDGESQYQAGFSVDDFFSVFNTGIETGRDDFFIGFSEDALTDKVRKVFYNKSDKQLFSKYKIINTASFPFYSNIISSEFDEKRIQKVLYRPFDERSIYYDEVIQRRASYNTMKHLLKTNIALATCRQQSTFDFQHIFVSNCITERCTVSLQTKETGYVFPLYIYSNISNQATLDKTTRNPNLNPTIVKQIAEKLNLQFTHEKEPNPNTFAPIDILDYIYAVLHSPTYRETYKEFLKIDFPRVPYPKDAKTFWALVALGGELRQLHLLESSKVEKYITQYPEDGDNIVGKVKYENERVYINETQYFSGVPLVAWEFYIGGYQPAQKWLKDRKGRELGYEDILHYQKVVVALVETDRVMGEVDKVGVV